MENKAKTTRTNTATPVSQGVFPAGAAGNDRLHLSEQM
jgi:hypothetical protein